MKNPVTDKHNEHGDSRALGLSTASGGSWGDWWSVYEIVPKDIEIQIEMELYLEREDRVELKKESQNQVGFRVVRSKQ